MTKRAEIAAAIMETYLGSNGDATKALYQKLEALGPAGVVAVNLFRALKSSERAKVYRGGIRGQGSYRGMAYDRKQWAMGNLCEMLEQHGNALNIRHGWGIDPNTTGYEHVLYVDIPTGQISFHTNVRGTGPDYAGKWDGIRGQSTTRLVSWITTLLGDSN